MFFLIMIKIILFDRRSANLTIIEVHIVIRYDNWMKDGYESRMEHRIAMGMQRMQQMGRRVRV